MFEPKKYTTIQVGTRVRTTTGETGVITENSRLRQYGIQIDGNLHTSYFEYSYVKEDDEVQAQEDDNRAD